MGSELHTVGEKRFDLTDLGLLDGPPEREIDIITNMAARMLEAPGALFAVVDAESCSVFLRARRLPVLAEGLPDRFPLENSLFGKLVDRMTSSRVVRLDDHPDLAMTYEAGILPFRSLMASPVHGPASETVGVLVVLDEGPREWSEMQAMDLRDLALLMTRHILLRASLETLKRLSAERDALAQVSRYRN